MNIVDLIKDYRGVVIEQIPQNVRDLLYEIEDFAKVKVGFRDRSLLQKAAAFYQVEVQSIDVESIYADHEQAYITIPDPTCVNANAVLHELLHLHRYWVEGVPQLEAKDNLGRNVEIIAELDNELEHLIIVPKERNYGFDPAPYWSSRSQQYWADFPWSGAPTAIRRSLILRGWLNCSIASDNERRKIEALLMDAGEHNEAERFRLRLNEFLHSKPRAASTALRFLKIPHDEVQLATLDIRNKKKIVSKIPPH